MLHKLALPLSFISLALIAALSISCGSSNSTVSKTCTGGPYNVVGDWQGTFVANGVTTNAIGAINSAGLTVFFDNAGDTAVLPSITGTCSFSGTETVYQSPGLGGGSATATVQGNVNSNTSITGTESNTNASGTFTLTSYSPITTAAAVNTTLTAPIQGEAQIFSLTFAGTGTGSSMTFTGSNGAGCDASGTFDQEGTNNVFDVSITFSGTGCPVTGTEAGLGFESSTDYLSFNGGKTGTYLYADILASSGAFVIEAFQQTP
jgi:hypothetical protein